MIVAIFPGGWSQSLHAALRSVLEASGHASIIVLLLLGVHWISRHRLSARWRYALWGIVVARLLLPAAPASHLSPLNLFASAPPQPALRPVAPVAHVPPRNNAPSAISVAPASAEMVEAINAQGADETTVTSRHAAIAVAKSPIVNQAEARPAATSRPIPWLAIAAAAWAFGAALLLSRNLWASVRLSRAVRRMPLCDDADVKVLLDRCSRQVDMGRTPTIRIAPAGLGPAVVGIFRPTILLPAGLARRLAPRELSLVLLHELVHIRRWDVPANWLLALLQAVHWFNPMIWLAFSRARADRELACDEAVLRLASPAQRSAYGQTLLTLIEIVSRGVSSPLGVGVLDLQSKARLRRRIAMIARFDRSRSRWSAAAVGVSALLAAVAFTGPVRGQNAEPAAGVSASPNAAAPSPAGRATPGLPAGGGGALGDASPGAGLPGPGQPLEPTPEGRTASKSPASNGFGNLSGRVRPPNRGPYGGGFGGYGGYGGMPGGYGMPGGMPGMGGAAPGPSHRTRVEDPQSLDATRQAAGRLTKMVPVVNFKDTALSDVLDFYRDVTGLSIYVDWKSLTGMAEPGTSVTVQLASTQADHALNLILRTAGGDDLSFAIDRGVIFISTRGVLNDMLVTRVYSHEGTEVNDDALLEVLRDSVDPSGWRDNGGTTSSARVFGDKLVITTTEPNHREIEKLVDLLIVKSAKAAPQAGQTSK